MARGGQLTSPTSGSHPVILRPREPSTVPAVVPSEHGEPIGEEPFDLPDAIWRDPSLAGARTTLVSSDRTEVIALVDPPEETPSSAEPTTTAPVTVSPKKRSFAASSASGRRVVNKCRRRDPINPQSAIAASPPDGPPSEPEEPAAPEEGDLSSSESGAELPDEEEELSEGQEAPPEEEHLPVGEEAAAKAPQSRTVHLQSIPKVPATLRGSIGTFLEPESSVDRSRSRGKPPAAPTSSAPTLAAPAASKPSVKTVATTVTSERVSGHFEEHTFSDGTKARVFVPDHPVEKAAPLTIGPPPPRAASAPEAPKPEGPALPPERAPSAPASAKPIKAPPAGLRTESARLAAELRTVKPTPKAKKANKAPSLTSDTLGQASTAPEPVEPPEVAASASASAVPESVVPPRRALSAEQIDELERDAKRQRQLAAQRRHQFAPSPTPTSGTGRVIPPRPGRPAPRPPTRDQEGAALSAPERIRYPAHYTRDLDREPPSVRIHTVEVDRTNIIACFDWHNTLDTALNRLNLFDQSIVNKFIELDQITGGRIEFHILSFSGAETGLRTRRAAENLCGYLREQGLKFRDVYITPDPVGPRGKSTILAQLGAHILVDDRDYITNECSRTGAKAFLVYPSANLSWFPQVTSWIRQKGVDYILQNHRASALRPDQFSQARQRW